MIDLPEKIALCPVVDGKAWHQDAVVPVCRLRTGRPVCVQNGWYKVDLFGREAVPATFVDLLGIKPGLQAYYFGGEYVPANFDLARRKLGSTRLEVHNVETQTGASPPVDLQLIHLFIVRKKVFLLRKAAILPVLLRARQAIDGDVPACAEPACVEADRHADRPVSTRIKGMTPEQVYLMGCYAIRRAEELKKLQAQSLPGRIKQALSVAGAKLISWKVTGEYVDVAWEFWSERFRSTVYKSNLQATNAGICLSGGDKEHSLASLPFMARHAIEAGGLHRTQHVE
jgi:hypothetical protein